MKPENNIENKAKFFVLYLGQRVLDTSINGTILSPKWIQKVLEDECDGCLNLLPLSKITDEDAIKVTRIMYPDFSEKDILSAVKKLKYFLPKEGMYYIIQEDGDYNSLNVTDYLRSRGYLVSWMGLTPDEIIERSWAKYKGDI